jgi:hypothetical protein
MNYKKIIADIKAQIKKANNTGDIDTLIDCNLRISGYLFYIHEQENEALRASLDATNTRKVMEAKFVSENASKGVARAQNDAIIHAEEIRSIEVNAEVLYHTVKGYRMSVQDFCSALTQKIAYLRKEKELTKSN